MNALDPSLLARLEPLSVLSAGRLQELAGLCIAEKVSQDIDPFRLNLLKASQAMYLLTGDLGLRFHDGSKKILRGGSPAAIHPIDLARMGVYDSIALTEIEVVRIDLDLLDIMMTWDQLSGNQQVPHAPAAAGGRGVRAWMRETSVFSADKLKHGVFSRLPPANIEEMFRRMRLLPVTAGQTVITQGAEGDYYYLIEDGVAEVTRVVDATEPPRLLAELKAGDAFGEDALVSENKRNASVSMKTHGMLLGLKKSDFIELLKQPILSQIPMKVAEQQVASGAIWLDVRFPSEYRFDHLPDAINLPLNELRDLLHSLDKSKRYITYCQTGRRSSAAAFILAEHGFKVRVVEGGTRAAQ